MLKLDEVVEAFEFWRCHKRNRAEAIPERLWCMVKALIPHYKKIQIQQALRLSGSQFDKHCGVMGDEQQPCQPSAEGFAEGCLLPQPRRLDEDCQLTLEGVRRRLQITINIQQMAGVLSLLENYL